MYFFCLSINLYQHLETAKLHKNRKNTSICSKKNFIMLYHTILYFKFWLFLQYFSAYQVYSFVKIGIVWKLLLYNFSYSAILCQNITYSSILLCIISCFFYQYTVKVFIPYYHAIDSIPLFFTFSYFII